MDAETNLDPLDEADWGKTTSALRRVARSVGAGPWDAEDVAQGALLAGLQRRAEGQSVGAGWLRRVVRHRTVDWLRRRDRTISRSEVQLGHHPEGAAAPAPELTMQFEIQRSLMRAVEALPEPYRETVFLRYFEEKSVEEIARHKGAPVPTVRTWLTRGHRRLRDLLGEAEGHRHPLWLAAFAEFGTGPSGHVPVGDLPTSFEGPSPCAEAAASGPTLPVSSLLSATVLMTFKTLAVSAAAVAALVLGIRALSTGESAPLDRLTALAPNASELTTPGRDEIAPVFADGARDPAVEPVEGAPQAPTPEVAKAPLPVTWTGRVLDGYGEPMAGLRVRLEPEGLGLPDQWTSPTGTIEVQAALLPDEILSMSPVDDGLAVMLKRGVRSTDSEQSVSLLLVLAPAQDLGGKVVDGMGEMVQNAKLEFSPPEGFRSRFGVWLVGALAEPLRSHSDAEGCFQMNAVPALEGCTLAVTAKGYRPIVVKRIPSAEEQANSGPFVIELEALSSSCFVRGVALDPTGAPVEGARVGLGTDAQLTDARGRFVFELDGDPAARRGPQRLIASAEGWCPVEFSPGLESGAVDPWPDPIELRFVTRTQGVQGRVLGQDGEPVPGACVWLDDPTVLGAGASGFTVSAEYPWTSLNGLHRHYTSDGDGRFSITGLGDRTYELVAMDPRTLLTSSPTKIAAGTSGAVLQLDPVVEVARIQGRVVTRRGDPVVGASVSLRRIAMWVPNLGESSTGVDYAFTDPVTSGTDGSFTLPGVPLSGEVNLRVVKAGYSPFESAVDNVPQPLAECEIQLFANCKVRIVDRASEDDRVDRFIMRDAHGELLPLTYSPNQQSWAQSSSVPIVDGATMTLTVSDAASEVVFYRNGEVVSTQALVLKPGEVTVVEP